MTPTLREQVIEVLRREGGIFFAALPFEKCLALVAHLCTLLAPPRGQPSRQALEAIVTRHLPAPALSEFLEPMLQDLMTWATGKSAHSWCPHLRWEFSHTQQAWTWFFYDPGAEKQAIAARWMLCPICGTLRPKEG